MWSNGPLHQVRRWGNLGENWPDWSLAKEFMRMAEGLFIWVSTVCNYIHAMVDPDEELWLLVLQCSPQGFEKLFVLCVLISIYGKLEWKYIMHTYGLVTLRMACMTCITAVKTPSPYRWSLWMVCIRYMDRTVGAHQPHGRPRSI